LSVGKGEAIPDACTLIRSGTILRLFDGKCQNLLKSYPMSPAHVNVDRFRVPKSSNKSYYIEKEGASQINICDTENPTKPFAKKGYMMRMKVKKYRGCPWENPPFKVLFQGQYGESLSLSSSVTSPWFEQIVDWPTGNNSVDCTINTASIGDPFSLGSTGVGSANASVYLEYDDPSDTCTPPAVNLYAHLNSLGLPIDWLSAGPIDKWIPANHGCIFFEHGWTPIDAYWTGAHFYSGPLGVVMNLFIRVWGIWS
jgi:hypothetical protein